MKLSWDQYYLDIAEVVARRSSCIKRHIGALIIVDNRIVSTGYNGTPRGTRNCNDGGCARCADTSVQSGNKLTECLCSHAEENAIVQAAYHGVSIKGGVLYTTFSPCLWCAKMIINAGIMAVICRKEYAQSSIELLNAADVQLTMLETNE